MTLHCLGGPNKSQKSLEGEDEQGSQRKTCQWKQPQRTAMWLALRWWNGLPHQEPLGKHKETDYLLEPPGGNAALVTSWCYLSEIHGGFQTTKLEDNTFPLF